MLIGRKAEQAKINEAISAAAERRGSILLLSGEAGMGKTHLAHHTLEACDLQTIRVTTDETSTPPYGPIISVLRSFMRDSSTNFEDCGSLKKYLAQLLPELGKPAEASDQATLIEALRCGLDAIAKHGPTVLFLDDLHWADNATLDLLPKLVDWIQERPILLLGAYRSDEIPRGHAIRRLRNDLRRAKHLQEIAIEPLNREETEELTHKILGHPPDNSLLSTIFDKTQGVPFFLEELLKSLEASGHLQKLNNTFSLTPGKEIPFPETVRDAILIRMEALSPAAKLCLELASVAGQRFSFELVSELAGEETFDEAINNGFIIELGQEEGQFRHALTSEAIYKEISWTKVRKLHRQVAEKLEAAGASPGVVAEHWLAGKSPEQARKAFVLSMQDSCDIHAYADAVNFANSALDLWPESEEESERLQLLDRLGHCAEISGSLTEATRAWREVAESYQQMEQHYEFALVQRKLATVYELQSAWNRALSARQQAANAFYKAKHDLEAISEQIAIASHLQTDGKYNNAMQVISKAVEEAEKADDPLLKARAWGLLGSLEARVGNLDQGLKTTQAGLSLALDGNFIGAASEIYQRLASVFEHFGDFKGAKEAYNFAYTFCESNGAEPMGHVCMACLTVVLIQTGEWNEAIEICEDVIQANNSPTGAKLIAESLLGLIFALRGEAKRGRKLLVRTIVAAKDLEIAALEIFCAYGLAVADWHDNKHESAREHCQAILDRWSRSEDRHYAIPALRFSASFYAIQGDDEGTRACADALAKIAASHSNSESLAALSHALGEAALVTGDIEQANEHFQNTLEILEKENLPLEETESAYRYGISLLQAQKREKGIELLTRAYHLARGLNARPYTSRIIQELQAVGKPIEGLIGKREAEKSKRGGLTRRQFEVVNLVALGMTNQQIAEELVLSARTVDMHVSNILNQLNSRSRAEAVRQAAELGLLN